MFVFDKNLPLPPMNQALSLCVVISLNERSFGLKQGITILSTEVTGADQDIFEEGGGG